MSRRIEIELTSARPDGTWTWRAAGAQKPKGVLDGSLLPSGASVGNVLRAEAEQELDGITILSVASTKAKTEKGGLLELLPSERPFEAVTQQLAKRDRDDRRPRRDGDDRRPRRERGERPGGPAGERRPRREGETGERRPRRERPEGERRPRFEAPPELPQRPKAKRLKPGRAHRNAVLAELDPAQRPVAERVLQGGIPAVRQAVTEQNRQLAAEGKEEIPAAGLLAIAEQLLPRLRVAEWLDRADAALADLDDLDLRDLRSVVAAAGDPVVARDDSTREVAERLKAALVLKQEKELANWLEDIESALGVGRVVRALKLSSQPPKAGVPFPAELSGRLAAAASSNLTSDALPDRWVAVLEAVAFSPVRAHVKVDQVPQQVSDELRATVTRLGSLLPSVAALFGIEVTSNSQPKPLRPTRPGAGTKAPGARSKGGPAPTAPQQRVAAVDAASAGETAVESQPVESQPVESQPVESQPVEAVAGDSVVVDSDADVSAASEETSATE